MQTAEELVALALPSVVEGLKRELANKIEWQVKEDAAKLVSAHVQEYVTAEILPEVTKVLVESKSGLISLAGQLGPAIVEAVSSHLQASLKERLEKSWQRDAIFKAMFG
jgi:hypothetical protein